MSGMRPVTTVDGRTGVVPSAGGSGSGIARSSSVAFQGVVGVGLVDVVVEVGAVVGGVVVVGVVDVGVGGVGAQGWELSLWKLRTGWSSAPLGATPNCPWIRSKKKIPVMVAQPFGFLNWPVGCPYAAMKSCRAWSMSCLSTAFVSHV